MSTRSCIALQLTNQSYISIYCHFDGDNVFTYLEEHFQSFNKVKALIDLGSISSITGDQAIAYHRDKGESWQNNRPKSCLNWDSLQTLAERIDANYLHLFQNNEWKSFKYSPNAYPNIYTELT